MAESVTLFPAQNADPTQRAELAKQFDAVRRQIDTIAAAIESATNKIRTNESNMVGNASILNVRKKFSESLADPFEEGAARLTRADMNEEGARLLAANARDALTTQGQRMAVRSDQIIVELIRRT